MIIFFKIITTNYLNFFVLSLQFGKHLLPLSNYILYIIINLRSQFKLHFSDRLLQFFLLRTDSFFSNLFNIFYICLTFFNLFFQISVYIIYPLLVIFSLLNELMISVLLESFVILHEFVKFVISGFQTMTVSFNVLI